MTANSSYGKRGTDKLCARFAGKRMLKFQPHSEMTKLSFFDEITLKLKLNLSAGVGFEPPPSGDITRKIPLFY